VDFFFAPADILERTYSSLGRVDAARAGASVGDAQSDRQRDLVEELEIDDALIPDAAGLKVAMMAMLTDDGSGQMIGATPSCKGG